jgi:hypothetical protein
MSRPGIGNPGNKGGGRGSYADDKKGKDLVKWMYGRVWEKIKQGDDKWLDEFVMKHGSRLIPDKIIQEMDIRLPVPLDDLTNKDEPKR